MIDIRCGSGASVHCLGKERKHRRTLLTDDIVRVLRHWINENPATPDRVLLTTSTRHTLNQDAIERRAT